MLEITYSNDHKIQQEHMLLLAKYGSNTHYPSDIYDIIATVNPKSILDYGCGHGLAGKELNQTSGINVSYYDPFVKQHSQIPNAADLVICWNVLNNIELEFLPQMASNLCKLTNSDLIIKLPIRSVSQSDFYTDHFRDLDIKHISNNICKIIMFHNEVEVEKDAIILTAWFTKSSNCSTKNLL